ncbi:phytoene/squalene synthase family protein [Sorangium atrum]|uniref:Phytoene/squalene synthase family protein n=1 Tax=Sorangium atrum TaxID=2995308 RepID=A0ABT5CJ00_9BACT|nr:phytoene/squalene synthase family protein [Sorangium aterium]MDC0685087.1 phytoene/squalene synthase family protein [Sorangium aterium]
MQERTARQQAVTGAGAAPPPAPNVPPTAAERERAERFCRAILPAASRTFALSIRALPGTLGRAVLAAYLICRIADTVEDERTIVPAQKAALLERLLDCFDGPAAASAFPALVPALGCNPEHARLVRHTPDVFTLFRALPSGTQRHVRRWVVEMVEGMSRFVLRYPNGIRVQTLDEFREYCYYVAGTVGYMLTDLWHEHSPNVSRRRYAVLRRHCRAFAQALQTVNILKDVALDAAADNAIYLPEQLLQLHGSSHATMLAPEFARQNHAAVTELIEIAWRDLEEARLYLLALPRRAVAIRMFCVFPLLFAYATLRDLAHTQAVLVPGDAPKISRREVKRLLVSGTMLVMSNRGVCWLIEQARAGRFAAS